MERQILRNIVMLTCFSIMVLDAIFNLDKLWVMMSCIGLVWAHHINCYNDALASEVMKIRRDIARLRAEHINGNEFSVEFLQKFIMANDYPASFYHTRYETPRGTSGGIIIVLDQKSISIDDDYPWYEFNANYMRNLNSSKRKQIKSGMCLSVYICEEKSDPDAGTSRSAKVLSIKYDKLTLEIDLNNWNEDHPPEKITRQIDIYHDSLFCEFVQDKDSPLSGKRWWRIISSFFSKHMNS